MSRGNGTVIIISLPNCCTNGGVKSGAEEVTRLHQRASQWCEEHGLPDDAIHHVLAARDWERAMRLIYAQSEYRINRGEFNTVLRWLQAIPDEVLRTQPRLYGTVQNSDQPWPVKGC
jgi:ATP/maltotriose-dependent transcriptional regulator MalT